MLEPTVPEGATPTLPGLGNGIPGFPGAGKGGAASKANALLANKKNNITFGLHSLFFVLRDY